MGPGGTRGIGVDIKHNSYHRYLARKKAKQNGENKTNRRTSLKRAR